MEQLLPFVPYALVALVMVMFYFLERETFNKIALAAFLSAQKELGTESGQERMASAVGKIIDVLPTVLKTLLTTVASLMGTDLHGLTHKLAQGVYDAMVKFGPPQS